MIREGDGRSLVHRLFSQSQAGVSTDVCFPVSIMVVNHEFNTERASVFDSLLYKKAEANDPQLTNAYKKGQPHIHFFSTPPPSAGPE